MDDKTRASAAFRQKALAERFARLRDAVADGIAPPPLHAVVAEDGDMMIRPVELRPEQIGAAGIHPEPILRAALDACHRCKQDARMGREPAAKTRLHGHAAQTGRLHDPGKFHLHPAGDGRDVGVALRAAMGHRETAAEAAIGHLQAEAVMQRRRAGEQGAGQRGKGLGIAQAKAEHGAQADLAHTLEPQLLRRIQQLARPHSEARGLRLVEAAVRLRPKPQAEPRRQRTLPLQPEQQPAVVQHEVRSRNGQLGVRGKLGRKADGLRGKAAGQRQSVLPRRDAQRPLPLLAQDAQNGRVRQRPHREPGPEPGAPRKGAAQPGRAGAELRLIIDIAGRRKRAEQLLRRKDGVLRIAPLRRGHCADKAGSGP